MLRAAPEDAGRRASAADPDGRAAGQGGSIEHEELLMLFELVRHKDVSGVSGTGVVAEGVQFSDGACALRWVCGKWHTDGNYPSIEAVIELHGHGANTEVRYVRAYTRG